MISVKINDKSNQVVGKLSQRFGMSKQSFISMVLGSLTTDDVLRLLAVHVREDEEAEYNREFQSEKSVKEVTLGPFAYEEDDIEESISDDEDEVIFEV